MNSLQKHWRIGLMVLLVVCNLCVWFNVYAREQEGLLTVRFIDMGQGDAILVESPSGGRMLIDGGRNRQIVSELGSILPFGDTRIDVLIATHTDADHIGGLPEVVSRFDIRAFIEPGLTGDNALNTELHSRLNARAVPILQARRGMQVHLGGGALLTVLFPNQDVSWWPANDASVVSKLTYGESSFLFTGDATFRTENILLSVDPQVLEADVLQAGHHGSRTSTSLTFAQAVSPEYTAISAGLDNSYGHPHPEVLQVLEKVGSVVLGTYEQGDIVFESEGGEPRIK